MFLPAAVKRLLPARRKRSPPPLSAAGYGAVAAVLVGGLFLLLVAYGRPLLPETGFALFGPSAGSSGSSALFDWYTTLHVIYGMGLRVLLWRTSAHWPKPWLVIVALAAAVLWEAVENMPAIAAAFTLDQAAGDYGGDTLLNAFGDVTAALAGYGLAARLPFGATLAAAAVVEGVMMAIGFDGLIGATWKVLAGAA
ncbi:DUF2585 family protein [Mongoliimonas terrestris]|uniref:DUF2585 family protein n=1 Tax=Mongoliimonas terrestris TaxID=1709001 RepID=UPI0009496ED7|nr:DUF2585 family protein [Mongoliimonas terrestris]